MLHVMDDNADTVRAAASIALLDLAAWIDRTSIRPPLYALRELKRFPETVLELIQFGSRIGGPRPLLPYFRLGLQVSLLHLSLRIREYICEYICRAAVSFHLHSFIILSGCFPAGSCHELPQRGEKLLHRPNDICNTAL